MSADAKNLDLELNALIASITDPKQFTIELDESQRQMVLMALAHLAMERPGWDYALMEIANKIDNERKKDGLPEMYMEFKNLHAPTHLLTLQLDVIGAVLVKPPTA